MLSAQSASGDGEVGRGRQRDGRVVVDVGGVEVVAAITKAVETLGLKVGDRGQGGREVISTCTHRQGG